MYKPSAICGNRSWRSAARSRSCAQQAHQEYRARPIVGDEEVAKALESWRDEPDSEGGPWMTVTASKAGCARRTPIGRGRMANVLGLACSAGTRIVPGGAGL